MRPGKYAFTLLAKKTKNSDTMAELPVIHAATNLVSAIRVFPANAAKMTFVDEGDGVG